MYIRKEKKWELWGSVHSSSIGCSHEGRSVCDCKYHLVNDDRSQIFSFNDWRSAENNFIELTGAEKLTIFNAAKLIK